jgi:hypothetical protein
LTNFDGDTAAYVNCIPCGDPNNAASVSQTIGTNIGDIYLVDFMLGSNGVESFGTGGMLDVAFGDTVGLVVTAPLSYSGFAEYSFSAEATSAMTAFALTSQVLEGGTFFMSDVSVVDVGPSAPEPSTLFAGGAGGILVWVLVRKRRRTARE